MSTEDGGFQITGQDRFKDVEDMLRELQRIGTKITGAKLLSIPRADSGGFTNRQIVERQAELGRDVVTTTKAQSEKIAKAFAAEVEKRAQAAVDKGRDFPVDGTAAAAMRKAMKEYIKIAAKKIKSQTQTDGSGFVELSEDYAWYKEEKFGFVEPILVATGQLRDNLNSTLVSSLIEITTRG